MKRLLSLIVLIPVAIALILFSVLNRKLVTLSLDPFGTSDSYLSITLPLFLFLFLAFLIGIFLGGMVTWLIQGKFRKQAHIQRVEAVKWHKEADQQRRRADELVKGTWPPPPH